MVQALPGVVGVTATACRSCGGRLELVLSLGEQPLANALVPPDRVGEPEPRFPLELALCTSCSLAQLTESVDPHHLFDEYLYFSSTSSTMVEHARHLVAQLVEERGLGDDALALEIASNDGYLLRHYVERGVGVLGVEPARNVAAAAVARGVPTRVAYFGREVAEELRSEGVRADVIHAHNVLAHVPDVNGVVAGIARILRPGGVLVAESPYVRDMVDRLEFDTIYHEHVFYYSLSSFEHLLRANGLAAVHVEHLPIHGGSLRVFAQHAATAEPQSSVVELLEEEARCGLLGVPYFRGFEQRVFELGEALRTLLAELRTDGRLLGAYGAAAKGAVLLNTFGIGSETLSFVADKSVHKQGLLMPGVRVPVRAPQALIEELPVATLLLAWNFCDEIVREQAEYLHRGGRFVVPVPEPRVLE